MPGRGKAITRTYTPAELAALGDAATLLLGKTTRDLYLNDRVYFANVPEAVYAYTIGGYQVIKKWFLVPRNVPY